MGGHMRVGLEDNIWYDQGRSKLASNCDLLKRIHSLAQIHERPVMRPARLRELLRLEPGGDRFGRMFPTQQDDS